MRSLRVLALTAPLLFGTLLEVNTAAQRKPARPTTQKPAAQPASTRVAAVIGCPSELGQGVTSKRQFCDVLTGRDPKEGVVVTIPPHRGPVTLSFDLHNRHMYSEELIKAKKAFRQYTATVGVLAMDNTLIDRAVIQSEFRSAADLVDRIAAGAGSVGVKAVAPLGTEPVTIELPEDIGDQVSILGEDLKMKRPDGDDRFTVAGRPIATISNVMLSFRPAPARRVTPPRTTTKKPPA